VAVIAALSGEGDKLIAIMLIKIYFKILPFNAFFKAGSCILIAT
jgi:hypothetical protein